MIRICANCKTPITKHVLVVDNKDFHRKTCWCWYAGHKVDGDNKKPQPCKVCEPKQGGKEKKPQRVQRSSQHRGRSGRTVMIATTPRF